MSHYYLLLMFLFMCGFGLHVLLLADRAVKTENAITKYRQYFSYNTVPILFRGAINLALCYLWIYDPTVVADGLQKIGITVNATVPLNPACALMLGLFLDIGITYVGGKVSWLGENIPALSVTTTTVASGTFTQKQVVTGPANTGPGEAKP